jgi:hypothetical protein
MEWEYNSLWPDDFHGKFTPAASTFEPACQY